MDIKGLKKLRKFLRALPEEAFDWQDFSSSKYHDGMSYEKYNKETVKHMRRIAKTGVPECGTVGCIAGWAAFTHPNRLRHVDGMLTYIGSKTKADIYINQEYSCIDITDLEGEDAFGAAFGLTQQQANRIVYGFSRGYENTKESAVRCLTDMIKEGKV